jgi:hypothetical protein
MKGSKQPVPVIKIEQYLARGRWCRRITTQEMAKGLGITTDPRESLAAKGRDKVASIIADECHRQGPDQ